MKTPRELCNEIKARFDYRSFYARYCPDLSATSGVRLHCRCPIPSHAHSGRGNPSLSIDLQRGLFHCFSRDQGGDAIRFYEAMHGVSFRRAVGELARETGILGQEEHSLTLRCAPDPASEDACQLAPLRPGRMRAICEQFLDACRGEDQSEGLSYLARRGIDAATMLGSGIVYFPRRAYHAVLRRMRASFPLDELQRSGLFNSQAHLTFYRHRLLFPFYVEGRAIYLQARTTASGVEPRWHNMRGEVPSLYNADQLRSCPSGQVIYLVEGFTDTLTLLAHQFSAVGLVGASGFKEEWLGPLGRFQVVAVLDSDAAGERAAARYRQLFAGRSKRLVHLRLPSDVNDFFRERSSAALEFTLLTEAALETG